MELVCRPSQRSSFLTRAVSLLGEFGPPEQAWFVLRSGLAAWLDRTEQLKSLPKELCRIPGQRGALPQEFLQLPAAYQLVVREARWDAQRFEVSLCQLQQAADAIAEIDSQLYIVEIPGPLEFMDYLLTLQLAGASESILEKLERIHGVVFAVHHGPRLVDTGQPQQFEARLAILGSNGDVLAAARRDLFQLVAVEETLPFGDVGASPLLFFTTFEPTLSRQLDGWYSSYLFTLAFLDLIRTGVGVELLCSWNVAIHVYKRCSGHNSHSVTRHAVSSSLDVGAILEHWLAGAAEEFLEQTDIRRMLWRSWTDRKCNCAGWHVRVESQMGADRNMENAEIILAFVDGFRGDRNVGIAGAPVAVGRFREVFHHYVLTATEKAAKPNLAERLCEATADLQTREQELAREQVQCRELARRLQTAEEQLQTQQEASRAILWLYPAFRGLTIFAKGIPTIKATDEPKLIPLLALRFTHKGINANFAFGEDHGNRPGLAGLKPICHRWDHSWLYLFVGEQASPGLVAARLPCAGQVSNPGGIHTLSIIHDRNARPRSCLQPFCSCGCTHSQAPCQSQEYSVLHPPTCGPLPESRQESIFKLFLSCFMGPANRRA